MEDLPRNEYCQIVYKTLLRCLVDDPKSPYPGMYVRELQETVECDKFHDLREYRKSLDELINIDDKERLDRVLKFKDTPEDGKVLERAMRSCGKRNQEELLKALSWPNYLYFQTVRKVDRYLTNFFRNRRYAW